MSDHYGPQVNRLDSRTRSLESEVSDLESEVDSLRSKLGQVDDLDYELRDIRGDISRFQDELGELGDDVRSDISDTDRALKRLTGRVQAPEAHFRASEGAPVADFDTIGADWRQLAQIADRGQRMRAGLLSDAQRDAHRSAIRAHQRALEERDVHRGKVIEACGTLATTPLTVPSHAQAVAEFGQFRSLADNHAQRAERLAAAAQKARAELAQDDALRQEQASLSATALTQRDDSSMNSEVPKSRRSHHKQFRMANFQLPLDARLDLSNDRQFQNRHFQAMLPKRTNRQNSLPAPQRRTHYRAGSGHR
ncbi:hypothetical protein HLK59_17790 [Streptomyces sp. S3(2020)]|uniref:hypothetical protein n=1 Tax=Streptomyces sp. S3(2020) TaxID=2732044 RepID=UPI001489CB83|nr:hypothetical protein [Streptomyces sp. S3(2020)]NNN32180.1 hypothetical protein [Streptomyces sp. S3(2020)]